MNLAKRMGISMGAVLAVIVFSGCLPQTPSGEMVIQEIGPQGGVVALGSNRVMIPDGAVDGPVEVMLQSNRTGASIAPEENEEAVSDPLTISHNAGGPLSSRTGVFMVEMPVDMSSIPMNHRTGTNIFARVRVNGDLIRLLGQVVGEVLQVELTTLPLQTDAQVFYNPHLRLSFSREISTPKLLTQQPPWVTTRWVGSYDAMNAKIRTMAAAHTGTPLGELEDDDIEEFIQDTVLVPSREAALFLERIGLRQPTLTILPVDNQGMMEQRLVINVQDAGGSFFDPGGAGGGLGQLVVDVDRIDDPANHPLGTVRASISHEMFHASFNGYEIRTGYIDGRALNNGLNEGIATVIGHTFDAGPITVRLNSRHVLNNFVPLAQPLGRAYENNDFWAYVGKRFDSNTLNYLGMGRGMIMGAVDGLLEQERPAAEAAEFTTAGLYNAYRQGMQAAFNSQFSLSAGSVYWDYARNRAYENNDESRLRTGDTAMRFRFNMDRFDAAFVHEHTFGSDNETVTLNGMNVAFLNNIPAFSTRAVIFKTMGFEADLRLELNALDWMPDALGNDMRLKVYRSGQDGVEFDILSDSFGINGFGEGGTDAILLLSNVSLDRQYNVEITARTMPSMAGDTGNLTGRVTNADTEAPIADVSVTVRELSAKGSLLATTMSDGNGQFMFQGLPAGGVRLTFSRTGFIETFQDAMVIADQTTQVRATLIVESTGIETGDVGGTITDATTGARLAGVLVELRSGILAANNPSGPVIASTVTDAQGFYSFFDVAAGTYTGFLTLEGYENDIVIIFCIGGEIRLNQNGSMSPEVEDEIRIILTWGADPRDLDSHLTGPDGEGGRFHVYWANRVFGDTANLDRDDTSSFGPETITVNLSEAFEGTYRYSVHDYTNRFEDGSGEDPPSTALSNSGATVQVITEDEMMEFNVPAGMPGTVWTVFEFEYDGEEVTIMPVNQFSFESSSGNINSFKSWNGSSTFVSVGAETPTIFQNLPEK